MGRPDRRPALLPLPFRHGRRHHHRPHPHRDARHRRPRLGRHRSHRPRRPHPAGTEPLGGGSGTLTPCGLRPVPTPPSPTTRRTHAQPTRPVRSDRRRHPRHRRPLHCPGLPLRSGPRPFPQPRSLPHHRPGLRSAPHAGFSAATYMFDDSSTRLHNRDSLGDTSLIEPGGLHWTVAGSGIVHDEVVEENDPRVQGGGPLPIRTHARHPHRSLASSA
ncbi:pirin family protein [Streptomyces sp. NPDC053750]|uniref:pirin family protein n=1 Tax=Streptomyces sp. NPDC053750 TaxID=3365714 RepID=UPI0037D96A16